MDKRVNTKQFRLLGKKLLCVCVCASAQKGATAICAFMGIWILISSIAPDVSFLGITPYVQGLMRLNVPNYRASNSYSCIYSMVKWIGKENL